MTDLLIVAAIVGCICLGLWWERANAAHWPQPIEGDDQSCDDTC